MPRKRKRTKKTGRRRKLRATEAGVAYAVLHPVRLDILAVLLVRIASRKELAKMLGKPLWTVGFHLKQLKADNVIEVVGEESRGGGIEQYFRAAARHELSAEELEALPRAARRRFAALTFQAIVTEGLSSLRHGQMDADDELKLVWVPLRLSREGQAEVNRLQAEMRERLEDIAQHDADRPEDDAAPVRIAAMMWFERGRLGQMPDPQELP